MRSMAMRLSVLVVALLLLGVGCARRTPGPTTAPDANLEPSVLAPAPAAAEGSAAAPSESAEGARTLEALGISIVETPEARERGKQVFQRLITDHGVGSFTNRKDGLVWLRVVMQNPLTVSELTEEFGEPDVVTEDFSTPSFMVNMTNVPSQTGDLYSYGPVHVLVVDGQAVDVSATGSTLKEAHYCVKEAESGMGALAGALE